jgi:hypothetical protein
MYDHSLQRFLKREEAAMRERGRIVMRGAVADADPVVIEEPARLDQEQHERLE